MPPIYQEGMKTLISHIMRFLDDRNGKRVVPKQSKHGLKEWCKETGLRCLWKLGHRVEERVSTGRPWFVWFEFPPVPNRDAPRLSYQLPQIWGKCERENGET